LLSRDDEDVDEDLPLFLVSFDVLDEEEVGIWILYRF